MQNLVSWQLQWGDGANGTLQMDGRRVPALSDVFFLSQQPLGNVRGGARCHSVKHCPFQRATPKFTTIIKHVLSSPPLFGFDSIALLCAWHLTVCGCLWSLQGVTLSGSAGAPRCTQLESGAKDLPFCPACWKEAEPFWIVSLSSEILNVVVPSLFLIIPLCSLEDIAIKDFTDPLKSSQTRPRGHKSSLISQW